MKKNLYFEDVEIGDDIGPIKKTVTDEDVIEFLSVREKEITPSRFTSNEVANSEGMPEAIVPGPMNIALMSRFPSKPMPTIGGHRQAPFITCDSP